MRIIPIVEICPLTQPALKYRWKRKTTRQVSNASIAVGLKTDNKSSIKYRPLFFRNHKYEVAVYFAPDNWEKVEKNKKEKNEIS